MASTLRLLVATLATTAYCFGCAGEIDSGDDALTADAYQTRANTHAAFDYFVGKGLSRVQAAGIVGNLKQESSVDPNAIQPGGKGRGIAQWSTGERWNGPGEDSLASFAARKAGSMHDLHVQLDFIWFELENYDHYGLDHLRSTTTLTSATYAFQRDFEACGNCKSDKRIQYAREILAAY